MNYTTKKSLLAGSLLLIFLIAQVAASVFILVVKYFNTAFNPLNVLPVTLFVANGLAIAGYLFLKPDDVTWEATREGFRYPRLNYTWLSLMMSPSVIVLTNLMQEVLNFPDFIGEDMLKSIIESPFGIFTVCLLGPLAEELIFRAGIQQHLQGIFKNPWWAILLSSLVFAAIHGNPAQMLGAFGIGLLLGWSYYKTGSVLPPLIIHIVNNSLACLLPDMSMKETVGGTDGAIILAIVATLWLIVMIKQAKRQLI